MPGKTSPESVRQFITDAGYEMRSEYVNAKTLIDVTCPNGHDTSIFWGNFRRGYRCKTCACTRRGNARKNSYEKIKGDFESRGWVLLSGPEDYDSNESLLKCICVCGRKTVKRYYDLMAGKKCWGCKKDQASNKNRITEEQANAVAAAKNLKIVKHDYKNMKSPVLFECVKCQYQFRTTLDSVKWKHTGCQKCNSSEGERRTVNFLEKRKDLTFQREYKFPHDPKNGSPGCRHVKDLPFDFYIETLDGHTMIIEIDGIHHFKSVQGFGGDKAFVTRQKVDVIKSLYCYCNRIPILRISYLDITNIEALISDFLYNICVRNNKSIMWYSDVSNYPNMIKLIDVESQKE